MVSGGIYHYGHGGYQYEFVDSALLQISLLDGDATLLVANAGWSEEQYDSIVQAASDREINLIWFANTNELTNYINTGGIDGSGDRANDLITAFYVFAHGTDNNTKYYAIEFGLYAPNAPDLHWATEDIAQVDASVFSKNSASYFYSCRTGNTFRGNGNFAQSWANKTGGLVYAYSGIINIVGRSDYSYILGNRLQRNNIFASKAYRTWRANRGDFIDGPSEAWELPCASYLTSRRVFSVADPMPQPGPNPQ